MRLHLQRDWSSLPEGPSDDLSPQKLWDFIALNRWKTTKNWGFIGNFLGRFKVLSCVIQKVPGMPESWEFGLYRKLMIHHKIWWHPTNPYPKLGVLMTKRPEMICVTVGKPWTYDHDLSCWDQMAVVCFQVLATRHHGAIFHFHAPSLKIFQLFVETS